MGKQVHESPGDKTKNTKVADAIRSVPDSYLRFGLIGVGALGHLVSSLEGELLSELQARRRPRADFQRAVRVTLQCIVSNVVAALQISNEPLIAYMSRRDWYTDNRHWLGPDITHRSVAICVNFLTTAGYVELVRGRSSASPAFRVSSSIRPLPEFRNLLQATGACDAHHVVPNSDYLPIRLKSPKGPNGRSSILPLPDTDEIREMASRVVQINQVLLRHWPDIELASHQVAKPEEEADGKIALPDLTKRTVYRVFNNGSFDEGGRFYGGWWQSVPKVWRPYITINGKRTVEVDFSEMHPTIVYHWAGAAIPENAYSIPGFRRELVKRTFNALLNAKGKALRPMEGFDEAIGGVLWNEFLDSVQARFRPVEAFFGTGVGLKLQKLDSDIAEAVMLEFAEKGIPILPVHDSFLCHHGYEQELREAMERHFERMVGVPIRLKERTLTVGQRQAIADQSQNSVAELMAGGISQLEAIISPSYTYSAHLDRVQTWFAKRDEIVRSLLP